MAKQKPIDLKGSEVEAAFQPLNVQLAMIIEGMTKFGNQAKKTANDLSGANKGFSDVVSMIGGLPGKLNVALDMFSAVALDSFINLAQKVKNTLGSFVQDFAPAEVEIFTLVIRDMSAVIGEVLVPVMQVAREGFRFIADTMAGVAPIIRNFVVQGIEIMRPAFESLGETMRSLVSGATLDLIGQGIELFARTIAALVPIFEAAIQIVAPFVEIIHAGLIPVIAVLNAVLTAWQPLIEGVSTLVQALMTPFTELVALFSDMAIMFADLIQAAAEFNANLMADLLVDATEAMKEFMAVVKDLYDQFREFLGLGPRAQFNFDGASQGKAVGEASTQTISSMLAQLDQKAFGAAQGSAERTATATENTNTILNGIANRINNFPAEFAELLLNKVLGSREKDAEEFAQNPSLEGAAGLGLRNFMRDILGV